MRRRDFIVLGAAVLPLAAPRMAGAQRPPPLVAFIGAALEQPSYGRAFLAGLRDAGLTPERDVKVEFYWAGGTLDPVRSIAARLLDRQVAVIVAGGSNVAGVVRELTTTVPIVLATSVDPIESGLVASLSRPGGNVTGLSLQSADITAKLVEMLRELRPGLRSVAVVYNPASRPNQLRLGHVAAAARSLGVEFRDDAVATRADVERVFAAAPARGVEGVVVLRDFFVESQRDLIVAMAARHRLPAIYEQPDFVRAGGLFSYSADLVDAHYRAAGYVARILRGARPADLPVEQPTKFELVINLKVAKALDITIPESLFARADELVE